jgi:hypothetical protein
MLWTTTFQILLNNNQITMNTLHDVFTMAMVTLTEPLSPTTGSTVQIGISLTTYTASLNSMEFETPHLLSLHSTQSFTSFATYQGMDPQKRNSTHSAGSLLKIEVGSIKPAPAFDMMVDHAST